MFVELQLLWVVPDSGDKIGKFINTLQCLNEVIFRVIGGYSS